LLPTFLGAQSVPTRPTQSLRHMHHTTWSAENGMVFSPRSGLVQTPDGYLWLGSARTLVRFDGVRFVSVDSATSPLLRTDSTGVLVPLVVDRDGVMWIARSDGAIIHYRQGNFTLAIAPDPRRGPPGSAVQDRTGRIWFNIDHALFTVDGDRIRRPRLPAGVPDTGVVSVVPDTGSGVWIGTIRQGLWHVVGDSAERIPMPPGGSGIARAFLQSSDGRLWVWGPEMLAVTDGTRWSTVLSDGVNRVAPSTVVESPDHQIWIGTQSDGLLRLADGTTEHYSKRHGPRGHRRARRARGPRAQRLGPDQLGAGAVSHHAVHHAWGCR